MMRLGAMSGRNSRSSFRSTYFSCLWLWGIDETAGVCCCLPVIDYDGNRLPMSGNLRFEPGSQLDVLGMVINAELIPLSLIVRGS